MIKFIDSTKHLCVSRHDDILILNSVPKSNIKRISILATTVHTLNVMVTHIYNMGDFWHLAPFWKQNFVNQQVLQTCLLSSIFESMRLEINEGTWVSSLKKWQKLKLTTNPSFFSLDQAQSGHWRPKLLLSKSANLILWCFSAEVFFFCSSQTLDVI